MAVIVPTIVDISGNQKTYQVTWAAMANGDTGAPIQAQFIGYSDRVIAVTGTFGAGGNMRCQGSLDGGTVYHTLKDAFGTAINLTAAGIASITEVTQFVRPNITAGDGTTALTVTLQMTRNEARRGG